MKVQLLYFDECPNWLDADRHLREALAVLGRDDVEVERVRVSTLEQAEQWRFHGSPSVLVNGVDPFAEPGSPVGLSCRLYRRGAGVAGAPTVELLVEALATG